MERLKAVSGLTLEDGQKSTPIPPGFGPSFLRALQDPETKRILIAGCGGGFDFTHSAILVPELKKLGKELVFLSYSFGSPNNLSGEVVYRHEGLGSLQPIVKLVGASDTGPPNYQPEIGFCRHMDKSV